ncbi:MAG TPA: DegT/DnrJ/EryC1/StrS family aminotransferase [Streptosporangiaceae bacterium]|nr:DegT/DnrJ/EryC1/StrS family aminotransferase [Streptosporangiaceae bacterium]
MLTELGRALAESGTGNAEVVRDLEARFAEFCGAAHALCLSSGTTALISALRATGVQAGDQVGVSVLGPSMTGLAVAAAGARPLFLDCASTSFGVSRAAADHAIRAGVTAVVLIPMWGYWDESEHVLGAFRDARVPIIVDAAQAPFLRLRKGLLTVADVACLSLHGRKPFKAGEGGVCLTDDPRLAERILALRNFGQAAEFTGSRLDPTGPFAAHFGVNLKINGLGAAWCLSQLAEADQIRSRFDDLRQVGMAAFGDTGIPWAEASQSADVQEHGRYGLVALCPSQSEARELARLIEISGVEVDSSRYKYRPMYAAPYLARFATECPSAEQLTATVVACRLEAFATRLENGG